jgi:cytochrome c oxidase subunit 3
MASHADAHHDSNVAHHFENADQQFQAANLGMWIFLATEILFFGGLFCAYSVYRSNHPEIFMFAHHFLDKNLGAVNTIILIFSSFTMAWAVRAAQLRQRGILRLMLWLTIICAFGFMGVKYVEYSHKWHYGLLWARAYHPEVAHSQDTAESTARADEAGDGDATMQAADDPAGPAAAGAEAPPAAGGAEGGAVDAAASGPERSTIAPAATGPAGLAPEEASSREEMEPEPANAQVFFSIYFLMTGLHGIHVIGGVGAMFWLLRRIRLGDIAAGRWTKVHMVGLYWHLVDLIWIYLFLLLYLIH